MNYLTHCIKLIFGPDRYKDLAKDNTKVATISFYSVPLLVVLMNAVKASHDRYNDTSYLLHKHNVSK